MDLEYVISALRKLEGLGERPDLPALPRRGVIPIKFRGGEEGQYHNPRCWAKEGYRGDSIYTFLALDLLTAITYALSRTVSGENPGQRHPNVSYLLPGFGHATPPGGRFDPSNGERMEDYKYGFPYVMAINYDPYRNVVDKIDGFCYPAVMVDTGEIVLGAPISRKDIFILFDTETDYFKDVPLIVQSPEYVELLTRREIALNEKPSV